MVRARDFRLLPYLDGNQMLSMEVKECPWMYTLWAAPSGTIAAF